MGNSTKGARTKTADQLSFPGTAKHPGDQHKQQREDHHNGNIAQSKGHYRGHQERCQNGREHPPERGRLFLEIAGTADLIQNNFSQKAMEMMLRKHMGFSVPREKKVPSECIELATIYNLDKRVCIPPAALKKAMLTAAASDKNLKKTRLRVDLYVEGSSLPITYEEQENRMDMVRTAGIGRQPDVRFRPAFKGWKCRVAITFDKDTLSGQTIVDLLHRAGTVGVGEWRPERDGTFGTFDVIREITDKREQREIVNECAVPLVPLVIPSWALDADLDPSDLTKIAKGATSEEQSEAAE